MQPDNENFSTSKLPLTIRRSIEFIGIFFLATAMVAGRSIVAPLLTAVYAGMVILPILRFLKRRHWPESIAISAALLILIIGIALIVWFFSIQVGNLMADLSTIKENILIHLKSLSTWINNKTHYSTDKQLELLSEQSSKFLNNAGTIASGAFSSISSTIIFVGLLPIYIFLILFYRNLLLRFVFMWFPTKSHSRVHEGIRETESIIKSYLVGLLIQISYITILLGGGLMLFGIKHALLIGIIFALLNLIPYIGALFGNIIGVLLTLTASQDLSPVIIVLVTIAVVQFLDNNILMPRIVGSKVKINALASIVGVIIGGSLGGIAGMFLSLPTIAVLKIIFDRTDNMKQWGILLGDEIPTETPMWNFMKKAINKPKEDKK
ncbi:MAG: AI-2E family transporter [Bacteroidetes bacterium]|nr:AI-2E family transporter [Bacteroidota bacterium]